MDNNLIRASDATTWVGCRRRLWFDYQPLSFIEEQQDAFGELIAQQGMQHELNVLQRLAPGGHYIQARDAEHTQSLITQRVPLIYQPVFQDKELNLVGRPDFLFLEHDVYRVADAKLAGNINSRKDIQIQLALYRRLFGSTEAAQAYLGNGDIAAVGDEANVLADTFLEDAATLMALADKPEADFSYSKCMQCPYREICVPEFESQHALTLLYRLDSRSVPGLNAQGVFSIDDLAARDWRELEDVPYLKGDQVRRQMIDRAKIYLSGGWQLLAPIDLPEGTWVHFDVESNPLAGHGGQVYLWGLLPPEYLTSDFVYFWSEPDHAADLSTWVAFLDYLLALREGYPDLILAHYGHFERTQIRLYATRYGMFDHPAVEWLLGMDSPLFDLFEVTKRNLLLPLKSYGLKAICKSADLVNFQWDLEDSGSQWSVVQYVRYAESSDQLTKASIKQEILTYNRDDVRATRALEAWLRSLEWSE